MRKVLLGRGSNLIRLVAARNVASWTFDWTERRDEKGAADAAPHFCSWILFEDFAGDEPEALLTLVSLVESA
jgi:hypothetical protein